MDVFRGKVKWFNKEKKYGFITGNDKKETFVHQSDIENKDILIDGQSVEYSIEIGPKGPKAKNVKVV